jgi:uncharacterized protein (TIGR00369 family)
VAGDGREVLGSSVAFDALVGIEVLEVGAERMCGRVAVRPEICQPFGVVHGGVYATLAESLASRGTGAGVWGQPVLPFGLSNNTSFLRPVGAGYINAVATPLHRGRTTWVWDVEMTDDAGKRCAVSRVTVAVRAAEPAPSDSGS